MVFYVYCSVKDTFPLTAISHYPRLFLHQHLYVGVHVSLLQASYCFVDCF